MFKYLTIAKAFVPLMPPIGDLPDSEAANLVEGIAYENNQGEHIKFVFSKPIRKGEKISEKEVYDFLHYSVEITTKADTIEEAANRSIFLLEQVLDTSTFFSQAGSKMQALVSIVNLTQIEEIIKNKKGNFEKGIFKKRKINEIKAFPPRRLVFLTEEGTKNIGRNLYWFRMGLSEFSTLSRFVSFFTALNETNYYFRREHKKSETFPLSVKYYIETNLQYPIGSLKKWGAIRNKIIHFSGRKSDYRKLYREAKEHLPILYECCYYAIAKLLFDDLSPPSPIIFYEDIEKEIVDGTPEEVDRLTAIWMRRNKGYKEIEIRALHS